MPKKKKRTVVKKKKDEDGGASKKVEAASSTSQIEGEEVSSFTSVSLRKRGASDDGDKESSPSPHFMCNYCEVSTESKGELVAHMRVHMTKCTECSFSSLSRKEVSKHCLDEHDKVLGALSTTNELVAEMDKDPCSACNYCSFQTYSTEHLEHHTTQRHPGLVAKALAKMISKHTSAQVRQSDALFYLTLSGKVPASPPSAHSSTPIEIDDAEKSDVKPKVEPFLEDKIAIRNEISSVMKASRAADDFTHQLAKRMKIEAHAMQSEADSSESQTERKVKVETIYCLTCPYTNVLIERLKVHTQNQHPVGAAAATYNSCCEEASLADIIFFCVKTVCSYNTVDIVQYQKHLIGCCTSLKLLKVVEKERLKCTVAFVLDLQKRNCLEAETGFSQIMKQPVTEVVEDGRSEMESGLAKSHSQERSDVSTSSADASESPQKVIKIDDEPLSDHTQQAIKQIVLPNFLEADPQSQGTSQSPIALDNSPEPGGVLSCSNNIQNSYPSRDKSPSSQQGLIKKYQQESGVLAHQQMPDVSSNTHTERNLKLVSKYGASGQHPQRMISSPQQGQTYPHQRPMPTTSYPPSATFRGRGRAARGQQMQTGPMRRRADNDVVVTAVVRNTLPSQRGGFPVGRSQPPQQMTPQTHFDMRQHFEDLACALNPNEEEDDIEIVGESPGRDGSIVSQPKAVHANDFSYCCLHCGKDQGDRRVMKQHMKSLHNDTLLGAFTNIETGQWLYFCPQLHCDFMTYNEQRLCDHLKKCCDPDRWKAFDFGVAMNNLKSMKIRQVNVQSRVGSHQAPIDLDMHGIKDRFSNSLNDAFDDIVVNSSGRQVVRAPMSQYPGPYQPSAQPQQPMPRPSRGAMYQPRQILQPRGKRLSMKSNMPRSATMPNPHQRVPPTIRPRFMSPRQPQSFSQFPPTSFSSNHHVQHPLTSFPSRQRDQQPPPFPSHQRVQQPPRFPSHQHIQQPPPFPSHQRDQQPPPFPSHQRVQQPPPFPSQQRVQQPPPSCPPQHRVQHPPTSIQEPILIDIDPDSPETANNPTSGGDSTPLETLDTSQLPQAVGNNLPPAESNGPAYDSTLSDINQQHWIVEPAEPQDIARVQMSNLDTTSLGNNLSNVGITSGDDNLSNVGITSGDDNLSNVGITSGDDNLSNVGITSGDDNLSNVGITSGDDNLSNVGITSGDDNLSNVGITSGDDNLSNVGIISGDDNLSNVGITSGDDNLSNVGITSGDDNLSKPLTVEELSTHIFNDLKSTIRQDSNSQHANDLNKQMSQDSQNQLGQDISNQILPSCSDQIAQESGKPISVSPSGQVSQDCNISQPPSAQVSHDFSPQTSQKWNDPIPRDQSARIPGDCEASSAHVTQDLSATRDQSACIPGDCEDSSAHVTRDLSANSRDLAAHIFREPSAHSEDSSASILGNPNAHIPQDPSPHSENSNVYISRELSGLSENSTAHISRELSGLSENSTAHISRELSGLAENSTAHISRELSGLSEGSTAHFSQDPSAHSEDSTAHISGDMSAHSEDNISLYPSAATEASVAHNPGDLGTPSEDSTTEKSQDLKAPSEDSTTEKSQDLKAPSEDSTTEKSQDLKAPSEDSTTEKSQDLKAPSEDSSTQIPHHSSALISEDSTSHLPQYSHTNFEYSRVQTPSECSTQLHLEHASCIPAKNTQETQPVSSDVTSNIPPQASSFLQPASSYNFCANSTHTFHRSPPGQSNFSNAEDNISPPAMQDLSSPGPVTSSSCTSPSECATSMKEAHDSSENVSTNTHTIGNQTNNVSPTAESPHCTHSTVSAVSQDLTKSDSHSQGSNVTDMQGKISSDSARSLSRNSSMMTRHLPISDDLDEEEKIIAIVLEKVFAKVPDMPKTLSRKLVFKFKQYANFKKVKITPDSKVIDEFVSKISYKRPANQKPVDPTQGTKSEPSMSTCSGDTVGQEGQSRDHPTMSSRESVPSSVSENSSSISSQHTVSNTGSEFVSNSTSEVASSDSSVAPFTSSQSIKARNDSLMNAAAGRDPTHQHLSHGNSSQEPRKETMQDSQSPEGNCVESPESVAQIAAPSSHPEVFSEAPHSKDNENVDPLSYKTTPLIGEKIGPETGTLSTPKVKQSTTERGDEQNSVSNKKDSQVNKDLNIKSLSESKLDTNSKLADVKDTCNEIQSPQTPPDEKPDLQDDKDDAEEVHNFVAPPQTPPDEKPDPQDDKDAAEEAHNVSAVAPEGDYDDRTSPLDKHNLGDNGEAPWEMAAQSDVRYSCQQQSDQALGSSSLPHKTQSYKENFISNPSGGEGASRVDALQREVSKIIETSRGEGASRVDALQREVSKIIETSRGEGASRVDALQREVSKIIETSRGEGASRSDVLQREVSKIIETSRGESASRSNVLQREVSKIIETTRGESASRSNVLQREVSQIIETTRGESASRSDVLQREVSQIIETTRGESASRSDVLQLEVSQIIETSRGESASRSNVLQREVSQIIETSRGESASRSNVLQHEVSQNTEVSGIQVPNFLQLSQGETSSSDQVCEAYHSCDDLSNSKNQDGQPDLCKPDKLGRLLPTHSFNVDSPSIPGISRSASWDSYLVTDIAASETQSSDITQPTRNLLLSDCLTKPAAKEASDDQAEGLGAAGCNLGKGAVSAVERQGVKRARDEVQALASASGSPGKVRCRRATDPPEARKVSRPKFGVNESINKEAGVAQPVHRSMTDILKTSVMSMFDVFQGSASAMPNVPEDSNEMNEKLIESNIDKSCPGPSTCGVDMQSGKLAFKVVKKRGRPRKSFVTQEGIEEDMEVEEKAEAEDESLYLRRSQRERRVSSKLQTVGDLSDEDDFLTDDDDEYHVETDSDSDSSTSGQKSSKRTHKVKEAPDPTALNPKTKGKLRCWQCPKSLRHLSRAKNHLLKKHKEKGLCVVDVTQEERGDTGPPLILFCHKKCRYATLDLKGLQEHTEKCKREEVTALNVVQNFIEVEYPKLVAYGSNILEAITPVKCTRKKKEAKTEVNQQKSASVMIPHSPAGTVLKQGVGAEMIIENIPDGTSSSQHQQLSNTQPTSAIVCNAPAERQSATESLPNLSPSSSDKQETSKQPVPVVTETSSSSDKQETSKQPVPVVTETSTNDNEDDDIEFLYASAPPDPTQYTTPSSSTQHPAHDPTQGPPPSHPTQHPPRMQPAQYRKDMQPVQNSAHMQPVQYHTHVQSAEDRAHMQSAQYPGHRQPLQQKQRHISTLHMQQNSPQIAPRPGNPSTTYRPNLLASNQIMSQQPTMHSKNPHPSSRQMNPSLTQPRNLQPQRHPQTNVRPRMPQVRQRNPQPRGRLPNPQQSMMQQHANYQPQIRQTNPSAQAASWHRPAHPVVQPHTPSGVRQVAQPHRHQANVRPRNPPLTMRPSAPQYTTNQAVPRFAQNNPRPMPGSRPRLAHPVPGPVHPRPALPHKGHKGQLPAQRMSAPQQQESDSYTVTDSGVICLD